MIDKSNYLFTQVKNAISSLCKSASQTFIDAPSNLPHMFFNQIDNSSTADDLDNIENAVNTTVEITIYTTGNAKLTNAKNIMNLADTRMRELGFRRIYGPQQITNISDTSICRYLARYKRIIGSGDTI